MIGREVQGELECTADEQKKRNATDWMTEQTHIEREIVKKTRKTMKK